MMSPPPPPTPSGPRSPANDHLSNLRRWRNKAEPDLSLGFLPKFFKKEVQKPYQQLGALVEIWQRLIPPELAVQTRLQGLSRGVLQVVVGSSSALYQIDRLLRQGVQQQIITEHRGPAFRKIQLRVGMVQHHPE